MAMDDIKTNNASLTARESAQLRVEALRANLINLETAHEKLIDQMADVRMTIYAEEMLLRTLPASQGTMEKEVTGGGSRTLSSGGSNGGATT